MTVSRPAAHFQQLYQASPDPWAFNTSAYEQAKYQHTMAALGESRFKSGLEVGCSIGILTRMLAPRCERLLGIDIVEDPLPAARTRSADQPQARFERMQVPQHWPDDHFDLIVFSEVLYFLSAEDIRQCGRHVLNTLLPGGTIVLVNWLGQTDDPSPADAAPDRLIEALGARPSEINAALDDHPLKPARDSAGLRLSGSNTSLRVVRQERHEHYRLDVLTRA